MELKSAEQLAIQLMNQHGLIEQGWRLQFDNAKRRFGVCSYRRKIIGLSSTLVQLNDEAHVRNTILHEIAHALTPGHHHDYVWKRKAIEIGCTGDRCYSSKVVQTPPAKYEAVCVGCGHTHKRRRNVRTGQRESCGRCSGGRFNEKYILVYKQVA